MTPALKSSSRLSRMHMQKLVMSMLVILCLLLGLLGCENKPQEADDTIQHLNRKMEESLDAEKFTPAKPVETILADTATNTLEGAFKAAQSPLVDIGIIEDPIPEVLKQYAKNAYALPTPLTCGQILGEIAQLDMLLGPDQCTAENPTGIPTSHQGEYIDEGSQAVQNRVSDTVTGYVNVMPFRSVVRYLSGAESHAREIVKAQQAGIARRAFLKGMAEAYDCRTPSSVPLAPPVSAPSSAAEPLPPQSGLGE